MYIPLIPTLTIDLDICFFSLLKQISCRQIGLFAVGNDGKGVYGGNMEAMDLGSRYQVGKPVLSVPGSPQLFEGFDSDTQQKVSIKVLKAIEDVGDAKQALRELRCMRLLKHTNIQGISDVFEQA